MRFTSSTSGNDLCAGAFVDTSQSHREYCVIVHFARGSERNIARACELELGGFSRPFSDVRRNRVHGAQQLRAHARSCVEVGVDRNAMHTHRKRVRLLPSD
jgi:hypothetical protein